jgi:hypothetical protein
MDALSTSHSAIGDRKNSFFLQPQHTFFIKIAEIQEHPDRHGLDGVRGYLEMIDRPMNLTQSFDVEVHMKVIGESDRSNLIYD